MNDNDDYLWNRSGAVDPQIAELERLLAGHALGPASRRALVRTAARRPRRRWRVAIAAAAVLALCAIGMQHWYQQRLQWDAGEPWQVIARQGDVRTDGSHARALAVDGLIETGAGGAARLRAAGIGEVAIGPGSRLRLVETRTGRHRVQLQQGRMWARVWAPPGQFGVSLPGSDVFDLGCEFELAIDAAGNGSLRVRSGWVQIDNTHREVLAPQGTRVRLHGSGAAGTPYAEDAAAAFIAALDAVDARAGAVDPQGVEVRALIATSRAQDAITLLSLLQAYPQLGDGPLLERMAQLLPAVPASRAGWQRDRTAQLGAWWNGLPYPRMKRWWMQWPDALPMRDAGVEAWLREGG
ncbi:MAG: hypothetical protein QM612_05110 [Thermomonas sp.]|uniref:FecR domain-containing protein n=1 Tax=Thermomonas sp. TaxID=1971895 RepID=UPI0039E29276